ncbi:Major heat shock 70 kDa protein Bb [Clydaea vesicula]|uniref:Major heat shock 70 kDa protein Bb n=1 Tax=Clydaea vesicula TaxID=447962 RepID=A0AAD5U8A9_9FUNG|nr:Major heat shock 70 kDa protein Bb [Clydaea vesicula]KAJ3396901.1 Major heat shock 70 kDa protein Bb [Lobulomyces angularis]
MSTPLFIGISFGTLNSSISVIGKDGEFETIANEDGMRNIPSCVAFTSHDELVGTQAKLQAIRNPRNTIVHFRNLLSRSFDSEDVKSHLKDHRLPIVSSPDDESAPVYEVDFWENPSDEPTKQYLSPKQITTKYLEKMKSTAEAYLGQKVDGCVLSTPTCFDDGQNLALEEAAKESGFDTVFLIKEPVAAAISFSNESPKIDKLNLVLDLGGHNFNVTVLSSNKGLYSIVDTRDDNKLGGVQLDEVLVNLVVDEFKRKTKMNLRENRRSLLKLRNACEQTKRALSHREVAPCSIESLHEGIDHHGSINRSRFELQAEPLFKRCTALVMETLAANDLTANDIDEVFLVGGCSKIPRYQAFIQSIFANSPDTRIRIESNPDEAISKGCIAQAAIIIESGLDHYTAAYNDISLTTNVPHTTKSIGIADHNGDMVVLIAKETPIPVRRIVEFSNSIKNQKELYLAVYEGENKVAAKNALLAEIVVSDLTENLEVGEAKLEVTFTIEKDKILHVVAKEKKMGKTLKVIFK